jgi:hypothetical protein
LKSFILDFWYLFSIASLIFFSKEEMIGAFVELIEFSGELLFIFYEGLPLFWGFVVYILLSILLWEESI